MTTLSIKAFMGDFGDSIAEVRVFTDKRLTELTIPSLKDAELESDFITTESWATIMWEDDWRSEHEDECDEEDEDEDEDEALDENSVGVAFWSSYEEVNFMSVTFKQLEENLMMRVQENCYEERTVHNGTDSSTVYVYNLNNHLFG